MTANDILATLFPAFQWALERFCLAGLWTLAAGWLCFRALPRVWRWALGMARLCVRHGLVAALLAFGFVFGAIDCGATKTNRLAGVLRRTVPAAVVPHHESWNITGCWDDDFRFRFDGDWAFPFGTNHLSSVTVWSQGAVFARHSDKAPMASVGVPLAIVPGRTTFSCGATATNAYLFTWDTAFANRDTNDPVTASIELFRNGDIAVTTNGVTRRIGRELPFAHDGFGQDEEWVRANFTNATEILSVGYPQWVDAQVGAGLANGLYRFTATFPEDPPECVNLAVGDLHVAVTNAGDYVFLLEKGPEYGFGTEPFLDNVIYAAADDVGEGAGGTVGNWISGDWTVGEGWLALCPQGVYGFGYVCWLPTLRGSPDIAPDGTVPSVFRAVVSDCRHPELVHYRWTGDGDLRIASPYAQETEVRFPSTPGEGAFCLSVGAEVSGFTVWSDLSGWRGTPATDEPAFAVDCQPVLVLNDDNRPERRYRVTASLACAVETNATVTFSCSGAVGPGLFASAAGDTPPAPSGLWLSTDAGRDADRVSCHLSCSQLGSGTVTAVFALPDGTSVTRTADFRVIEPLRRLVTNERVGDGSFAGRKLVNPPCLVFGDTAALRVAVNGDFAPEDVHWSVVSGPGVIVSSSGFDAEVGAVLDYGTVVVEARFGEDEIQPRFVLPVVGQHRVPVRAFVVNQSKDKPAMEDEDIYEQIAYANRAFAQAGMFFDLVGIEHGVSTPADWTVVLNEPYVGLDGNECWRPTQQALRLVDTYSAGDCIEVYYTGNVVGGDNPVAGCCGFGIIVGRDAVPPTLAHEIGHSFGLTDIYDGIVSGTNRQFVVASDLDVPLVGGDFSSHPEDWGAESGRGFYGHDDTHLATIRQLLMFGRLSSNLDIPFGSVRGFPHGAAGFDALSTLPVGVSDMHQDIRMGYSK